VQAVAALAARAQTVQTEQAIWVAAAVAVEIPTLAVMAALES